MSASSEQFPLGQIGGSSSVQRAISSVQPELVQIRRHLHAHPEPSGEEFETTKFLVERLQQIDADISVRTEKTGLIADLNFGNPASDAPCIGIRADIDALRIQDEKITEYSSRKGGLMHACGHDAHTTMVLGTALIARQLDQLSHAAQGQLGADYWSDGVPGIRLRLIFQPAEETCQGARWMVNHGAVEGLSWMLGVHVDPERIAGQVGLRYGTLTANCDEVQITITGQGGHAARPHHSRDPIEAAGELIQTLYARLPRSIDSREPAVFSIGSVHGGTVANVIPDRVELTGTLRTADPDIRIEIQNRIHDICAGLEHVARVQIRTEFLNNLHSVDNHPLAARALENACKALLPDEHIIRLDQPSMGGEDFSVYLQSVPGAMLRLGCARIGEPVHLLHSSRFDIDERILSLGSQIFLKAATELTRLEARPATGSSDPSFDI